MRTLKRGANDGAQVKAWQTFITGQGIDVGRADGSYGRKTEAGTKVFQNRHDAVVDGVAGNRTYAHAMWHGLQVIEPYVGAELSTIAPIVGNLARQRAWGPLEFVHAPTESNREHIKITNGWYSRNIARVTVPQLEGIRSNNNRVPMHRGIVTQFLALWRAWEAAGLLELVRTWHGCYVPRLIRGGSRTSLSNHAFGTAFDINARWNRLGTTPAQVGERGSVRELVSLANIHGFYWGGHYGSRPDGMHFEAVRRSE